MGDCAEMILYTVGHRFFVADAMVARIPDLQVVHLEEQKTSTPP